MSRLCGIWGLPYVDLEGVIDTSCFPDLDREISYGLTELDVSYTGGSLKWMNVVAPWVRDDPYADLGHIIGDFDRDEFARFVSLADDPSIFELDRFREYTFGDETDHPLNRRQVLYLKYQHGVYFPWKVCYHLLSNDRWEDKHTGRGKRFAEDAARVLPKTVAFVKSLPFTEIGRCVLFGIEANDHAPMHRDSEPGKTLTIPHSISFDPRGTKRFVLCDKDRESVTEVTAKIYWFNDMDYHGVEADPFFRYSIRVDGVFDPTWLLEQRRRFTAR
jgi:hypothetical protein